MTDLSFSGVINYILYAISGFCFGIFASRYSVLYMARLMGLKAAWGLGGMLLKGWPQVLFILIAFILFPTIFSTRTPVGAFVYYTVLVLFFSKGYRNLK